MVLSQFLGRHELTTCCYDRLVLCMRFVLTAVGIYATNQTFLSAVADPVIFLGVKFLVGFFCSEESYMKICAFWRGKRLLINIVLTVIRATGHTARICGSLFSLGSDLPRDSGWNTVVGLS
jgi:hypothetical protein